MHISIADLELALAWIKANSTDITARLQLEPDLKIHVGDKVNGGIACLTLFDAARGLQAKISTEDYLKHKVKSRVT